MAEITDEDLGALEQKIDHALDALYRLRGSVAGMRTRLRNPEPSISDDELALILNDLKHPPRPEYRGSRLKFTVSVEDIEKARGEGIVVADVPLRCPACGGSSPVKTWTTIVRDSGDPRRELSVRCPACGQEYTGVIAT